MSPVDEHPFLAAILDRPSDDGPRLVYADYLDDKDTPEDRARAELIRVQIALAGLADYDSLRPRLKDREADLLQAHRAAWTRTLLGLAAEVEFRRGLPDSVAIDAGIFLARGAELFRRTQVG